MANVRCLFIAVSDLTQPWHHEGANGDGTVYFTAPLYRKNLHYSVVPKSSSKSEAVQAMADYILEHHPNDSGIVYCLSKAVRPFILITPCLSSVYSYQDAENVKDGLEKSSGGKILTGVYHADRSDREKENLHKQWRKGAVKVVCATIGKSPVEEMLSC